MAASSVERIITISALVMGFSGQVAQIILLREFLIVVSGNEFYLGILLSSWLLFEALGSILSIKLLKKEKVLEGFIISTMLFCIFLSLSTFLVRILKPLLKISIGEQIGLGSAFFSSLIILFPVSATHGSLFVYTCEILSLFSKKSRSVAGYVYAYETVGSVAGGIILTFVFLSFFNSFETVHIVSIANLLVCLLFLCRHKGVHKLLSSLCLFAFTLYALLFYFSDRIHWYSILKQWSNLNVVHYENSKYGNISVVENERQYIFFQNGVPEIFVPYPEMHTIEEIVHIPLFCHENPKKILIVGVGAGGTINEILKHPGVERIHYVELDPLVLRLLKAFSTSLTEREFSSEKLTVIYADGRFFLNYTNENYDLIFVGIKTPSTLEANRLFTKEFFMIVKNRLNKNGIFVISVPFFMSKRSEELESLVRSVHYTLSFAFNYIRVFPGESRVIFLCSDSDSVLKFNRELLRKRIAERGLAPETHIPWYIEKKFHPGWEKWFESLIKKENAFINSDSHPAAVFYTVLYFQSIFSPFCAKLLRMVQLIKIEHIFMIFAGIFLTYLFACAKKREPNRLFIFPPILTSGFYGMVIELIVIFSFQSLFGYVFLWVGILLSAYMAGGAVGAYLSSLTEKKKNICPKIFGLCEFLLFIFPLVFAFAIELFNTNLSSWVLKLFFISSSIFGGALVGAQFPLANTIHTSFGGDPTKTYALTYGFDLAGGFIGGIVGGIWLLPLIGLKGTCYILSVMKLASGSVFVIEFLLKGKKGAHKKRLPSSNL